MNFDQLGITSIDRIIAHRILPKKSKKEPAYAETIDFLLSFSEDDKQTLIGRIREALSKSSKTFQLDFYDKQEHSVYDLLQNYKKMKSEEIFISCSINLADKLAESHYSKNIPAGYCLIGDGYTSSMQYFFFIIKAEPQEVFNIQSEKLQLIKDVFLSPAKDFYKIGFFVENYMGCCEFTPYMYDDMFSSQKKDLTEYFYSDFLGLTTSKNDSLKTKNWYQDTLKFIQEYVPHTHDVAGLTKALQSYIRDDMTGTIEPREFGKKHFYGFRDGKIEKKYEESIVDQFYPDSFVKDMSRLSKTNLELQRVNVGKNVVITSKGNVNMQYLDNPSIENLAPILNSGNNPKIIVIEGSVGTDAE